MWVIFGIIYSIILNMLKGTIIQLFQNERDDSDNHDNDGSASA